MKRNIKIGQQLSGVGNAESRKNDEAPESDLIGGKKGWDLANVVVCLLGFVLNNISDTSF